MIPIKAVLKSDLMDLPSYISSDLAVSTMWVYFDQPCLRVPGIVFLFLYNLSFNFVTLFHGGGTNFANWRWPQHFWGRISTLIAREDRGEPIWHLFVWDARICYCIFDPWVPALPPTPRHPPVLHDPFVDLIWLPYICAQDAFCFHGSAWGQIQTPTMRNPCQHSWDSVWGVHRCNPLLRVLPAS